MQTHKTHACDITVALKTFLQMTKILSKIWLERVKRVSVEIGQQVRLLHPWARHLTGLSLPLTG